MTTPTVFPTGAEYRDALFNTNRCFEDPILRGGIPLNDAQGMPKPISGNFATVFTVTGRDQRKWGVKCFTRYVADQQLRYERIGDYIGNLNSSWKVPFEYAPRGILCLGNWFPILRMEWIEASGLIPYVEDHLRQPAALATLASEFANVVHDLSDRGIAHGDLQHGNLLVTATGRLKLVDYDGMYVPGLDQLGASELGHPNYQSPTRSVASWGPALDRFSAWIIYCSLVALALEPSLWDWLHRDGDEALIFTKKDFVAPSQSLALRALASSPDRRLQVIGQVLEPLAALDPAAISPLDPGSVPVPSSESLTMSAAEGRALDAVSADPTNTTAGWLASLASGAIPVAGVECDSSWVLGHLPPVERIAYHCRSVAFIRIILVLSMASFGVLAYLFATGLAPILYFSFAVPVIALLAAGLPWVSMRRTHEWSEKRTLRSEMRKLRRQAVNARGLLAKAESYRRAVDRRERESLDEQEKLARKAAAGENSELSKIEGELSNRLSRIQKDLQGLSSSETRDRESSLLALQRAHVMAQMSNARLASASIPGIGSALCSTLQANGISSAADFAGISYYNSQVFIQLRNGRRVHPPGIGSVKAQALEKWRRSVEARAQATRPSSIPHHEAQAIRAKYSARKADLERSANEAKVDAARRKQQTRQKWAATHLSISAQVEQLRKSYADYRADADLALIGARRTLSSATYLEAAGKHRLFAYTHVTYFRYLTQGIRG
jgi:serine/threonine protein kinase